jgi:hypothetical protein
MLYILFDKIKYIRKDSVHRVHPTEYAAAYHNEN